MYLCYIDESGTPQIPGNTSHFILAGLAIPIGFGKGAIRRSISLRGSMSLKKQRFM
jgi:hypothetical protein